MSTNSPMLARIVRFLEYYKQEPSEFVMCFDLICYSRRESFEHLFTIKMTLSSANNHPTLYIFKNWRYCSEKYAQMVDVDKIMPFWLHAAADLMEIKPLVELISLGILIGYMWVSVFNFW
jgi:hypothetical protein